MVRCHQINVFTTAKKGLRAISSSLLCCPVVTKYRLATIGMHSRKWIGRIGHSLTLVQTN